MTDTKRRELEAEMAYKKALLDIENDEIEKWLEKTNLYYANDFKKEGEEYRNRYQLFEYVQALRTHVDNSRARLEEIKDLEEELGIREEEYI